MRRKYTAAQIRQLYAERKDRKDPLAGLTLDEVSMLARLYLGTEWSSIYCTMPKHEYEDYYLNGNIGYAWHISKLQIYDSPRELDGFKKVHRDCFYADLGLAKRDCPDCKNPGCFLQRPLQSWCYVEDLGNG